MCEKGGAVKLSVSVPESLWHELLLRFDAHPSPSAIVQLALSDLLDDCREHQSGVSFS